MFRYASFLPPKGAGKEAKNDELNFFKLGGVVRYRRKVLVSLILWGVLLKYISPLLKNISVLLKHYFIIML